MPPYRNRHNSITKPRTIARAMCILFAMASGRCWGPWICKGGHPLPVCIMKRDCATAGNLEVPELLLGIYALLCPPWRTLRTVQLLVEAQVGSPTVSSDQVPS